MNHCRRRSKRNLFRPTHFNSQLLSDHGACLCDTIQHTFAVRTIDAIYTPNDFNTDAVGTAPAFAIAIFNAGCAFATRCTLGSPTVEEGFISILSEIVARWCNIVCARHTKNPPAIGIAAQPQIGCQIPRADRARIRDKTLAVIV